MSKNVSLVLGSGGARGLAHIGVIKYLKENGYEIKSVSGCSIGSLIGGVYAAGKLDLLEQWMLDITKLDIVSMLDLSWKSSGLIHGDAVINKLVDLIGDIQIEELDIPYTAVAADIKNQKEVWMNKGSLFDAIRASVSLPLLLTPVERDGLVLVDGGVLNPVPITPTFNDKTDLTIAVNLGGPPSLDKKIDAIEKAVDSKKGWMDRLEHYFDKFNIKDESKKSKEWGAYDVANEAFDTMQSSIARQKLASYPPDIEITIARNACGTLEFDRAKEMIELGYESAIQSLK
ncbi:MAG: patatin-like phospholipase family protein [Salibacteraceae bacterium]